MEFNGITFSQTFFHGTRAELNKGDLIEAGFVSNYGSRRKSRYVYFSATLDAAIWGAELAQGEAKERIYLVEPTGHIENDPNLTDKRFPGNPSRSYRTQEPLKVIGEVGSWISHPPAQVEAMKNHLEQLRKQGVEAIEE